MKIWISTALLLLPAAALAASGLDGSWKLRLDSLKVTGKPDSYVIVDGMYSCSSCAPAIAKVPADGAFHKIDGHAYYDEIAIKVVNPNTVEISTKQKGKLMGTDTATVSADGKTLNGKFTGYAGTEPVTGTYTETRTAPGPAGSHAISGSWLQSQINSGNDALRNVDYAMSANGFTMKSNGQSYDAKFDGKQYPVAGDPGHTMVTLKKVDDNTVEETDYRQGKAVDEIHLAAAKDGKTVQLTDKDLVHEQTTTMIFDKQ